MTEDLTIGERIVLLALDEETGTLREAPLRVSLAVSAAALLELGTAGYLTERDGALVVAGASTPADPAAAAMAAHLRSHPEETPREWLLAVREQALDTAYKGLSEKGLVREQGRRVLGAFGSVKYPVTGLSELEALRGRLTAVLEGQEPDERTAALITVLHHAGLQAVMLRDSGAEAPEYRLSAIAEGQGTAAALGDAIRTTVAALTAVIASSAL
ncbi:GPP34 family phosphoprotein [Streptomyces griseus]|uniref:GOLPH3/VPS74 family protein n=1 Tax=Streptomyces griseus TaxID=1911 RepID=UPI00055D438D|nr:GPP34 family phosphoprotein [Streptomyces griseus]